MIVVSNTSPLLNLACVGRLALALAARLGADLLLIDERLGRQISDRLGLRYTGLIGVLVEAKRSGLVEALRPLLDALRDTAGFFISQALYDRVLSEHGEG